MTSEHLTPERLTDLFNALGRFSDGPTSYYTGAYLKNTLSNLFYHLLIDDKNHTFRRHVGRAKVLEMNLLPILIHHPNEGEVFDIVLRLLLKLTNPALLIVDQEQLPSENIERNYFWEIKTHIQSYKAPFTQQGVWNVLQIHLDSLLRIEYYERDEDQRNTVERILLLARNVLKIPSDVEDEKQPNDDASVHGQVLWTLHQAGMFNLFFYIASTECEQHYYGHLLEIIFLMLQEHSAENLNSDALRSQDLLLVTQNKMSNGSSVNSAGGSNSRMELNTDRCTVTVFEVQNCLRNFCRRFLIRTHNKFMILVQENVARAVNAPYELFYFWVTKFFMLFNRLDRFPLVHFRLVSSMKRGFLAGSSIRLRLVEMMGVRHYCTESETMDQQFLYLVQLEKNLLEQVVTGEVPSRRIYQALIAYQELLMSIQMMERSPIESVRESGKKMKSSCFQRSQYHDLIMFFFRVFTESKFSRLYLSNLVETTCLLLDLLEQSSSKHHYLAVQGKTGMKNKKKKSKKSVEEKEAFWDNIGPELAAVLQGHSDIPKNIILFESDIPMGQQKFLAMKKIQRLLKHNKLDQAIGLMRASREVWRENDCFGQPNMPPNEEYLAMKKIFMKDFDDEEGDIAGPETHFNFSDFVARFTCPEVLAPVCLLLKHFMNNSEFTNNCIIQLLRRVACDCKMPAALCKETVFQTLQNVLGSTNPQHKELSSFADFMMMQFDEIAKHDKETYAKLLIWKTNKVPVQLDEEHSRDLTSDENSHSAENIWRAEDEDERQRLTLESDELLGVIKLRGIDVSHSAENDGTEGDERRRQIAEASTIDPDEVQDLSTDEVEELIRLPGIPKTKPEGEENKYPKDKGQKLLEQFVREDNGGIGEKSCLPLALNIDEENDVPRLSTIRRTSYSDRKQQFGIEDSHYGQDLLRFQKNNIDHVGTDSDKKNNINLRELASTSKIVDMDTSKKVSFNINSHSGGEIKTSTQKCETVTTNDKSSKPFSCIVELEDKNKKGESNNSSYSSNVLLKSALPSTGTKTSNSDDDEIGFRNLILSLDEDLATDIKIICGWTQDEQSNKRKRLSIDSDSDSSIVVLFHKNTKPKLSKTSARDQSDARGSIEIIDISDSEEDNTTMVESRDEQINKRDRQSNVDSVDTSITFPGNTNTRCPNSKLP